MTRHRLYTPDEVALVFRVDVAAVSRWLRERKMAGVRHPGGKWRVSAEEIERFLAPDLDVDELIAAHRKANEHDVAT